jgi:hypothetical protein
LDTPSVVARTMGLRGILDYDQVVAPRDREQRVEVRRPAVQVHRHNRLRPRRDGSGHRRRIDRVGRGLHVDEYRRRAHGEDRQDRRDERIGGRDDFVAGPDFESAQRELDCRQPGADADRVARADERGILAFEALDRGTQDEIPALEQLTEDTLQRVAQRLVLRTEIHERHLHRRHLLLQPEAQIHHRPHDAPPIDERPHFRVAERVRWIDLGDRHFDVAVAEHDRL